MEKIDALKLSTDAQQEIRYQVIRLKEKGLKNLKSATLLEFTPDQESEIQKAIYDKCPDQMPPPLCIVDTNCSPTVDKATLENQNANTFSRRIFNEMGFHPTTAPA